MKVTIKNRLNHIPRLNDCLDEWNHEMKVGDILECTAYTSAQEYRTIRRKYPLGISNIIIPLSYIWNDMCPKMKWSRGIYLYLTQGQHRSYSHTEILGRICRAGFRIISEKNERGHLHIVAEKRSEPLEYNESTESPLLRLYRVGKDGKMIKVYKFRTMYSYSQYLQDYVYERNKLNRSGKLKNDFRVNIWGKLFRSVWLDELPMLWNVIRGDMKWVGVRPLSEHFFSLYTPEMQKLRTKVKPGMLPPFYYEKETPKGLDEIQASERRYVEAYLKHPILTDWRYFWGTVYNILIKSKRSK
ncbi:MAG: sugar transferase [Bacteroidaceae bacterium]|nr:sugar transferase [Bacteroidaceae bacterium]